MKVVKVKKENRIAYITMNRPDKRNALSYELVNDVIEALIDAEEDRAIRVVILSGEGKGFSAGGDLETIHDLNESASIMKYMKRALEIVQTIRKMDTYVVAAVNGFAAGAGFSIAMAADFIVAESEATFVSSFSNIALIPDLGLMKVLTDNVPRPLVKEWISAAKPVTADELKAWGLVNHVAKENLIQEANDFAQFIVDGPPLANRFVKQFVNHADKLNYETSDLQETAIQTLLLQSEDNKEGIAAFFEKRKPNFIGN
ncbi:enoyl-CoA hydratase/isomerase family protein [Oceanobacillus alkalisoli]|uniref:enoyl-CoA hydratase/isomerase family protein n=1 Tax=Oceanobacillus alkalisoli TaxID=2925113 RepID=UPI001F11E627|nr:enoyl-CoA hydratase/isomerase family protein [Oceanobacillus alkalisoli]MCF3944402.1 enoyl-CoA hydratase/isomerase family protein [Oceanobacillus alkalisoli]